MKLNVLCNSRMALPALQFMLQHRLVQAVGIPAIGHDATQDIQQLCGYFKMPVDIFMKEQLAASLAAWTNRHKPDVILAFTFPWKIPASCLSQPPKGYINFHFGILPQYRGADAIFWQIKNRELYGGISVHRMDGNYDTGKLLHVEKIPIAANDTYGMHMAHLGMTNIAVVEKVVKLLELNIEGQPQHEQSATYHRKPGIQDICIDWKKQTAVEIAALVNACNPWNKGAYAKYGQYPFRITVAQKKEVVQQEGYQPGEIISTDKELVVACSGDTQLVITIITLEEGIYTAEDACRIMKLKKGDFLS